MAVTTPTTTAGSTPSWAWLATPSVDPWEARFTWLDPNYGGQQIASILPPWLDQWADPAERLVLLLCASCHRTARDAKPVQSAVIAAIAGLILLSEARYVGGGRLTVPQWAGDRVAPAILLLMRAPCA